ncbi:MAG: carboxyl transferase domain-containing protein [Halieaceae bacterium]|nr:carboxyl transferase domain-containing protein [Halieaceae bacterium]
MTELSDTGLTQLRALLSKADDSERMKARERRHTRGYRTARENLDDLVDEESFLEYGQLAVAPQRSRKSKEELQRETPADGIIAGIATINSAVIHNASCKVAILINDYTVLAGTQGFYHHQKLDRICEIARNHRLPTVMFMEGGGDRPADTDVNTQVAGLNTPSFARWAALDSVVPSIAVNNDFCFAGNASLFGAADYRDCNQRFLYWYGKTGNDRRRGLRKIFAKGY